MIQDATPVEWLADGVPLPGDIRIASVGDDAPERSKRFVGAWVGAWDDVFKHVLIVEDVRADGTAQIVTALGEHHERGVVRQWRRAEAVVSGDTLTIASSSTATYTLATSDTLTATYRREAIRRNARLSKIAFDALIRPGTAIAWRRHTVDVLDTALSEGGKPVRLEVVMFKPDGAGPFPLLVMNHGSTGRGNDPRLFKETTWHFAVADFLTRRGWLVAFPQRRGRGNSDGLYDEGLNTDRRRYTCDPDRSLAGADRALADIHAAMAVLRRRPDVDSRRILIGGNSRGGVLSIVYAAQHPDVVSGVINVVGGWLGTGCPTAAAVNGALFQRGAAFTGPTIWLYGEDDSFYSIDHSRANFATFERAGGTGRFFAFDVPGTDGHGLSAYPELWSAPLEAFMAMVDAPDRA